MTATNPPAVRPDFRKTVEGIALNALARTLPPGEVAMAAATVAQAFAASRAAARSPADFDAVLDTPQGKSSIARAVAQAALCRVYPGGVSAAAYLVPGRPRKGDPMEIRYSLSHRGVAILAAEEGWSINPVPVHVEDAIRISFGEVELHESCGKEATVYDDLLGVYVTIRRNGQVFARPWVSVGVIEARAARSPTAKSEFSPWKSDPIAMAQKTAIHYCVARGILPIRSTHAREAMGEETEVESAPVATVRPIARKAISEDFTPEETGAKTPETVTVNATPNEDEAP